MDTMQRRSCKQVERSEIRDESDLAERVDILRRAFDVTVQDSAFLKETENMGF
jgi:hypothetical protein